MEKIKNLLTGNYWIIPQNYLSLSQIELDFLRYFFDISFDVIFDEFSFEEKRFIILKKKAKFLIH